LFQRYFREPYRFIAPYRSKFWCRLARNVVPIYLRRMLKIMRWQFEGLDGLRASFDRKAGILLASNHCCRSDPIVLSELGIHVNQFFYYVVAYHQFKQSRALGWLINRLGGYSIWREGSDRECLRVSARILAEAERPLVLFPEGTWFRQNDRLGQLQDGLSLIPRLAARDASRPIVVHPVAIKYWLLEDPQPALQQRLTALEARLGWQPQDQLDIIPRIEKLASALLTIKECELWGTGRAGTFDERISGLANSHVSRLENELLGKVHDGLVLERIRRLRQVLARQLMEESDESRAASARRALDLLLFCENLSAHSEHYLREHPSLERLMETVLRIEETVTDDIETAVAPLGVTVTVGPAIEVRWLRNQERKAGDSLVEEVASNLQGMLDQMLAQGPPAGWSPSLHSRVLQAPRRPESMVRS
jgi:hypothetical protein